MLPRRALILHLQYYKMKLFTISPFSPSRQRYILDFVARNRQDIMSW
tara:strand:- start:17743 stop:17883 length:141 start_codon:yes stop_codon:yes gene_type:complete